MTCLRPFQFPARTNNIIDGNLSSSHEVANLYTLCALLLYAFSRRCYVKLHFVPYLVSILFCVICILELYCMQSLYLPFLIVY